MSTLPDPFVQPVIPAAYFDPARGGYWIKNSRGGWIIIPETALKRQLRPFLRSKCNDDQVISPLDAHLNTLQTEFDVAFAGPLAGAHIGLVEHDGRRLLITESPRIMAGVPGEWPVFARVLENLLLDEVCDQRPFFYGWMKVARESLVARVRRPGQVLCLAGPHDCGKSLVQNLITPLLGNRAAKPYGWMTGATDFNAELFGAEHLIVEDEAASTDIRARRAFGAKLKEITVNDIQKCHAKNRQALNLSPFWRTTVTVNNEPENLMVLPPLDESIEDKIILLRANKRSMPMSTATFPERQAFMATLLAELPAFCAFLDAWQIPSELVSQRFGVTHYHHPDLLRAIDDLAPETRLWQLIETEVLADREIWTGTAEELERALTGSNGGSAFEARRLLTYNTACGVYLARLAGKRPDQVEKDRNRQSRRWTIRREPFPALLVTG
jgi:hypothetical protein